MAEIGIHYHGVGRYAGSVHQLHALCLALMTDDFTDGLSEFNFSAQFTDHLGHGCRDFA